MKLIVKTKNIELLNYLNDNNNLIELSNTQIILANDISDIISSISNKTILLLDHDTDSFDAIDACTLIRKSDFLTYIIIRSKFQENYMRVAAFNNGCNDYIDFSLPPFILLKKIKSTFQYLFIEEKNEILHNEFVIRLNERTVIDSTNNKLYDLPNKQFELFVELCSKPGKVFKREHLYRKIWGTELNNGNRTLDVHIRGIRSILSTNCIKTVKGVGYKVH